MDLFDEVTSKLNAIIFHLEIIRDSSESIETKEICFKAIREINETLPEEMRDEKLRKGITTLEDCINFVE